MSQQHPTPSPVWRLADLAVFFGVDRTTIYDWRTRGKLDGITHYDPGGRPYFLADEVETWARGGDLALSQMESVA